MGGEHGPELVNLPTGSEVAKFTVSQAIAAELRAQARFYDAVIARRGNSRGVQTANKAFALVSQQLRKRADELDGGTA